MSTGGGGGGGGLKATPPGKFPKGDPPPKNFGGKNL
jgi:hypothetical protein